MPGPHRIKLMDSTKRLFCAGQYDNARSMSQDLLVGIVAHERALATAKCVESVLENTSVSVRVVVADNGSQREASLALLEKLERTSSVEVIRLPENSGPSGGKNAILSRAAGEPVVALLDNDTMVLPGWETAAMRAVAGGAGLVQPKLLTPDLLTVDRGPNRAKADPLNANPEFPGRGAPRDDPSVACPGPVAIVGCGLATSDVFRAVGMFDTSLRAGEDYDLSIRAAGLGFRLVYEPGCEIVHNHEFDLAYDSSRGSADVLLVAFVNFWRKHGTCLLCPRYLAWYAWLAHHREPMYLPAFSSMPIPLRRLRRRLARSRCLTRNPERWGSQEDVQAAIRRHRLPGC